MDWTGLGLRSHVIDWLEDAADARYAQDRRLDPFATSMRDFDDASAHLKAIRDGKPPAMADARQRITDLRNAGLVVAGGEALTSLGVAALDAWERYAVDTQSKSDEFARLLLMALEARRIADPGFSEFFQYWSDLRTYFSPFELIQNWDALYQINYLDFERRGFTPGTVYRDQEVSVADIEFDLADYARSTSSSAKAISGAERIEDAIGGKLPRGRHRATFCMGLEIVLSDGSSAATILDSFGFPKKPRVWDPFSKAQKSKINTILADYGALKAVVEAKAAETASDEVEVDAELPEPKQELALPAEIDFSSVLAELPKPKAASKSSSSGKGGPKKVDYKQKAHVSDAVGKLGEEFAIKYEEWRLRGHPDLLKKLRHVSKEDDTAGYDIESFELDGTPRYVEVKSTLGPPETRFFMSAPELSCAESKGDQYVILRVANLTDGPSCCEIRYPFEGVLDFVPTTFSVGFSNQGDESG
jgi:hypothetical protein